VVRLRHQHVHVAAQHVLRGIAEQPLGSGIERFDPTAAIDDDDRVDSRVDDRSIPFFAGTQGRFDAFGFRDVSRNR
jgi:hypothetical protein